MRIESFFGGKPGWIAVILAIGAGSIQASTMLTFTGSGGSIPDADPSGSPPGVFTSDIICNPVLQPDCNGTINGNINDVSVAINGLQHTFAGDLIATLTDVTSGISQDLFNRILKNPSDPNDFGCACQFGGDYSFSDQSPSFPGDIWGDALTKGSADTIDLGNYWTTTAGSNTPTSFSAAFAGRPATDTWRLTISDNSPGDTGSLLQWTLSLNVTTVPEPSFAIPSGLLVLGLVLFQRRRSAGRR